MRGLIVCNGSISDYSFYQKYFSMSDLIVCADGGANHAKRFGIVPHVLIGDFDSVDPANLEHFRSSGTEILKFPPNKDMTDTELAIELAIERGCKYLFIIGGLGSRLDHTLSNVLLLRKMLERNVDGLIVNELNTITLIRDEIRMDYEPGTKVTLLPLTDTVEGVITRGLQYPLAGATINMGSSWGVSNEFSGGPASVSISKGLLLVIRSRE